MSEMEEKEKEAFFDELYQLDEEDSSEEDESNASIILRQSRLAQTDVSARGSRNKVIHPSRPDQSLLRTVSAPLPQPSASNHRQSNVLERGSFTSTASSKPSQQVIIDTPVMAKKSVGMTALKEVSRTTGKRKRGQSLELKPESQRIFDRLAFCQSRGCDTCISFIANMSKISYRTMTHRLLGNFEFGNQWNGERSGLESGETALPISLSTRNFTMRMS